MFLFLFAMMSVDLEYIRHVVSGITDSCCFILLSHIYTIYFFARAARAFYSSDGYITPDRWVTQSFVNDSFLLLLSFLVSIYFEIICFELDHLPLFPLCHEFMTRYYLRSRLSIFSSFCPSVNN